MFADRSRIAELAQLEPVMVRLHTLDQRAVVPETVEEDVAEVRPVAELDPQFVGAVRRLRKAAMIATLGRRLSTGGKPADPCAGHRKIVAHRDEIGPAAKCNRAGIAANAEEVRW